VGKDVVRISKSVNRRRHPLSLDLGMAKLGSTGEESSETHTGTKSRALQKIKGFGDVVGKYTTGLGPENDEGQNASMKKLNIETVSPADVSKQVLLDCNFIRGKLPSVRTLRVGDGRLSMLPEKSVREIYHDVIHKDISSFRKV